MTDAKNALAELAERLELDIRMIEFGNVAQLKRFRKVKRIVAELAKVRDTNWLAGHNYPEPNSSSVAVSNCRAIAEEGASND